MFEQIVLHLLCTYLDSHLPLSPLSSDRRPFTSQYLVKYPDKPGLYNIIISYHDITVCVCVCVCLCVAVSKCSDDVAIYQTSLTPPHYNVGAGVGVGVLVV